MSKPLRVGLMGAGRVAGAHLRAYQQCPDRVQVMAVCDLDEAAARRGAAEAHVDAIYTVPERMLGEARIDAVDICAVHDQHAWLALAAIDAGKHVLVEKPMACSLAECHAMVRAAERAGVTLMVAQCLRYLPGYRAIRRAIREEELGPIRAVRLDCMQNLPAIRPPDHWLFDGKRAGGGVVISNAVHHIDLARYLVGEIHAVAGMCRTTRPEFVNGAEDTACATLAFAQEAVGELFATYAAFRLPWSEQLTIFGEEGVIHTIPALGQSQGPAMIACRARGDKGEGYGGQFGGFARLVPDEREGLPTEDGFVNEILHFAECCASGREPISSGRDNLGTMRTVFGIYESARTGQSIELAKL
jgi:predicted dehydrogenase